MVFDFYFDGVTVKTGNSLTSQRSARIQDELRTIILERKARNDEVFDWIDVSSQLKLIVEADSRITFLVSFRYPRHFFFVT